jgi:hypothetical protein
MVYIRSIMQGAEHTYIVKERSIQMSKMISGEN